MRNKRRNKHCPVCGKAMGYLEGNAKYENIMYCSVACNNKKSYKVVRIEKEHGKDIKEVLEELLDGKTNAQVAKILGVARSTIPEWRKKYGVEDGNYKSNTVRRIEKEYGSPIKEVLEELLQEYNVIISSDMLQVSRKAIYNWVKKYNVKTDNIRRHGLTEQEKDKIIRLYMEGKYPIKDIMRVVGVSSPFTVWKVLKKHEISTYRRDNNIKGSIYIR